MRSAIFAVLVAVPVAIVTWVLASGHRPVPQECVGGAAAHAAPGAARPHGSDPTAKTPQAPSSAPAPADADAALKALVASPLPGVRTKGAVALYDAKGLFDYIDGAAPLYIDRGFRRLAAAEMATADGGELTCDVYDMGSPDNARAIFEKERSASAKPVPGWPEAVTGPKSLVFRHARYYAKLTAFDDKAEARLPELAKALRERMR